ncbi:MAG: hypothetical protein KY437_08100 [Actinobacteria bacterium]|nr:hypothetical protein [Actinomycetota bacterium]
MHATVRTSLMMVAAALAMVVAVLPATAQQGRSTAASLPSVTSGARPGPPVLYAPTPDAPPLENRHPRFRASPLLVSGTEAYVDGEYLYQGHLYDDYGSDTNGQGNSALSSNVGDITYPTDVERYGGNAADLVEFRLSTGPDDVLYRFTLNTLLAADTTIVAVAFDTDGDAATGTAELPGDPNASFPGTDEAIVTWGTGAQHHDLSGTAPVATDVAVSTDLEANQITVTVPRSVSDPSGTWRTTVALGLHDGSGGWLLPGRSATEDQPGGANLLDPSPTGIFNVAFRFDTPYVDDNVPPDALQAPALRSKTPTDFAHDIDFDALAAGEDRSTVPETGTMVRLFPSRLDLGEGRNLDTFPAYLSQLQPYSLYVPTTYDPATPVGVTFDLHSLGQEHWQYNGTTGIQQLGEERDSVVATPLARGPDGWYQHEAEYDTFEVWNDVARHFSLDPDRAAIAGYSMGGYGTYRLGGLYPDLFGAAFTTVGPPGDGIWIPPDAPTGGAETLSNLWLENVRNLPYLNLAAAEDELVPVVGPRAQNLGAPEFGIDGFEQLGYRYRFRLYPTAEHFTIAALDYDVQGAVDFLGDAAVDRAPHHVTLSYLPATDDEELGLVHDHAYWVSDVRLADTSEDLAEATVDAVSRGHGLGDPESTQSQTGGVDPIEFVEIRREWAEPPQIEAQNLMEVTLTNVGSVRFDLARAQLHPREELTLQVTADSAGQIQVEGDFLPDTQVLRDGQQIEADVGSRGASIPVVEGEQEIVLLPAVMATPGPPEPDPRPAPLPTTGGGTGALAVFLVLTAAVLRRRREGSVATR